MKNISRFVFVSKLLDMFIITQYYNTPCGELILGSYGDKLCLCDWRYRRMRESIDTRIQKGLNSSYEEGDSDVIRKTIFQLEEYFNEERTEFDIPLLLVGTDFQKKVWETLLKIPYGKTETYGDLAKRMDNLGAIRAVGTANGANATSIIVPCHRIIGADGKLVGYAGGLTAKKKLLTLESVKEEQLSLGF